MTCNRNSKTQRVPRKTASSEWWPVCMASRVTNVTTAFSSSSEPTAIRGQSNPLYVTWSGLCSCRFVFLRERPWQSIMIFRAIWQEAGSGYSWPWNDTVLWPSLRSRTLQFWLEHSRSVIQINWKFIQFSQNTTNTLLSIYKSDNTFRLIEPSSDQFTNHIEGKFSTFAIPHCAHLLNVPPIWFVNWPDDGSMSWNMLPDLKIDKKVFVVFWLNWINF